ncbi:DUF4179 domain-containing protein [Fictibacillus nanhaiensis]|uniref:DUF4179 domain-containing protein n=1 Tax=Fictibacillus nanhaiensis TaxID=742169 RepID=UPI00203B6BC3|nr:DUF4179 domain-containing protein [Fictibacillus nanhaiensis]MCM3733148.1 DUF4179 domain-containing protein [Fictibacillus nanhaiensis]
MFKREEEQLNGYKNEFDNIPVSLESLDQAILSGFNKAKTEERKSIRKKRSIYSFIAAALLLIGLFSTIRISPVFASYISEIPGMEKIVELIRDDKGRLAAIENKYYQELEVSSEVKDGVNVTLDGTIADEMGIVLYYTLHSEEKQKSMMVEKVKLRAKDGTALDEASISYGAPHESEKGQHSYSGEIDYYFEAPLTAKDYVIDIEVQGKEFSLPFTLNDFKKKKEYFLNKTLELEGQKINIEKVIVYPLRIAVYLETDPDNKKQVLHLDDLRIVDEKGGVWGKISNGVTGKGSYDEKQEIYLQSNYFHEPKELYLQLNKAQAVNKEELYVVVDPERQKILKQPEGNMIKDIRAAGNDLAITLKVEEFPFGMFSEVLEMSGEKIEVGSNYITTSSDNVQESGVYIPGLSSRKEPIKLKISYYPSWIKGNEKIRIK